MASRDRVGMLLDCPPRELTQRMGARAGQPDRAGRRGPGEGGLPGGRAPRRGPRLRPAHPAPGPDEHPHRRRAVLLPGPAAGQRPGGGDRRHHPPHVRAGPRRAVDLLRAQPAHRRVPGQGGGPGQGASGLGEHGPGPRDLPVHVLRGAEHAVRLRRADRGRGHPRPRDRAGEVPHGGPAVHRRRRGGDRGGDPAERARAPRTRTATPVTRCRSSRATSGRRIRRCRC